MIIAQTFEIPASRRLHLDLNLPSTVPAGKAKVEVIITPITAADDWSEQSGECLLCTQYKHEPNEETIAAIEEGRAMRQGEIPSIRFTSFEDFMQDLKS